MDTSIFKSKTFWGTALFAAASVVNDHSPTNIAQAVGTVIAAVGVRHAIAKNGTGQ